MTPIPNFRGGGRKEGGRLSSANINNTTVLYLYTELGWSLADDLDHRAARRCSARSAILVPSKLETPPEPVDPRLQAREDLDVEPWSKVGHADKR